MRTLKQRTAISLVVLVTAGVLSGIFFTISMPAPPAQSGTRLDADETEETESPADQAHWDWMRLHDPKTGAIPDGIRKRELAFAATLPTRESVLAKSSADAALAGAEWQPRGPFNVGGRTRALAVDVANGSTLLAGGASGGMWRSTDGGASWSRTTRPEQLPAVSCVSQDPRAGHTDTWYYGTGEFYGNSATIDQAKYSGDGIFKSTDDGRSWNILPSTVSGSPTRLDNSFEYVWDIAVDPSNTAQDEVYAAVYGGIKRSTDGGATWTDVLGGFASGASYTDVAVTHTGVVYASLSTGGNPSGLWRSPDGINWVEITPVGWPTTYSRIAIGPAPSNDNIVYFVGETPNAGLRVNGTSIEWHSFWKYTYRSGDGTAGGGTWNDRSFNLPPASGNFGGFRSQHSYDLVIRVKPDDENTVFLGGTNLYRSTNAFASSAETAWIGGYKAAYNWLDFSYPHHHPDQHAIAFAPNDPNILYSGNDGGIARTGNAMADTVTWETMNHGYQTTQLYALAIDHGTPGDNTIIAGMQDNSSWMTHSGGGSDAWRQVSPADGAYCAVANGGTSYYVSTQGGRIFRVGIAEGADTVGFARIDPNGAPAYLFVNPFALDPTGTNVLYDVSGSSLWRNTNPGGFQLDGSNNTKTQNWTRVTSSPNTLSFLTAIGVSTNNPSHRVYIGTTGGEVAVLENADKLTTSPRLVTGSDFPGGYVSCVTVDPDDGNKVIAVFANYGVSSLFYTSDGGENWAPVAGNLEEHPDGSGDGPSCRWAAILHRGAGTIYYVGTSIGLYSTTFLDGMKTVWVQEGPSTLGNVVVDMVDVRQSDGLVAVGTHGNGVFTTTINDASAPNDERAAAGVVLEASVPNPMHGTAMIRFMLAEPAAARLSLYDLSGRLVRRVIDGTLLGAGSHTVQIDALDPVAGPLPAGAYYYQLEASGERRTRRMLVVP